MHTESSSGHRNLEALDFLSLVRGINQEDALCHQRVASEASHIAALCELVFSRLIGRSVGWLVGCVCWLVGCVG